jgi:Thrombospondin type 3 repeat
MNRTIVVIAMLVLAARAHAITGGQADDFEDGTTDNWTEGSPSPNEPVNVPSGGPDGAGDAYMQNVSSGGAGPGSGQVSFNFTQWVGDYTAAGVTAIEADMANPGVTDLHMRIAVQGGAGTRFGSATAVDLPAGTGWQHVRFELSDLTLISGPDPLNTVLTEVSVLRILSAAAGPDWEGDRIVATLNVDNITAIAAVDTDGDGVPDASDNCTLVANADQRDTNGDGYGNICDPDLDNNGIVNFTDLGLMKIAFFQSGDLDADLDGNQAVNFLDLSVLKTAFFGPPGPSGLVH